jgi:hypothetical protein
LLVKFKQQMVSWCSWLSRQSNTLKVSGSNPGEANSSFFFAAQSYSFFLLITNSLLWNF